MYLNIFKNYALYSRNLAFSLLKKITLFTKIKAVSVHEAKAVSCCKKLSLQALDHRGRRTGGGRGVGNRYIIGFFDIFWLFFLQELLQLIVAEPVEASAIAT
jgi:hypothetical protein